jgi:tetratricopeptide (TPR) repeat protein
VARAIAREIKVAVTPAEETRLASARSVNPEAHEAYLKGRFFWNKRTGEKIQRALEYFQQAVELDPGYALAHAGLADSYLLLSQYSVQAPSDVMPKAKREAMDALERDEMLAEAHTSLAAIKHTYDWDWAGAEREFVRAIELNSNYATAHQWYAEYLRTMGRLEEALGEMKRALELDPLSPIIHAGVGWTYYYARQYDSAIEQCRKTLEMHPDFLMAHNCLAAAYREMGLVEELILERQTTAGLVGGNPDRVRRAYEAGGLKGYWRFFVDRAKQRMSKGKYVSKVWPAAVYALLGEKEEALAWLEKAYRERDPWLMDINVRAEFDSLRDDPRFQDLLRRMNFPPQ